ILKIVISICFLVSRSLTSIGQDRVEVYGPAPRPYDYPWLIPSYNSFGISYYPSATINNQGNGDQNTGMIAFDFRRLYFNPEHYSPISIGCSFEGFFTPAPANNYNVQYYGGSVNFCLFLLPRKLFASPIS